MKTLNGTHLVAVLAALSLAACGSADLSDLDAGPADPDGGVQQDAAGQADAALQPDADTTPDARQNSAPVIADVSIAPLAPTTTDNLVATPGAITDADGDTVTLTYSWSRDGVVDAAQSSETVDAGATAKAEVWVVTVTPNDGTVDGAPVTTEVTIINSVPVVTAVLPASPVAGIDDLVCVFNATDADGDAVVIGGLAWTDDGVAFAGMLATTTLTDDTIPAAQTLPQHVYGCTGSYDDGDGGTGMAMASTTVNPPDLVLTANMTLAEGSYLFADIVVPVGITLTTEGLVQLDASSFTVEGAVNGVGAGHPASPPGNNGQGPGAGTASTTAGAGGGSYAGVGGTGGFDSGDGPGTGGPVYGMDSDQSIEIGSSGGSTDQDSGGAGGGALRVTANLISVAGTIDMSGGAATQPGSGRAAGGGSGGGILLVGGTVSLTGTLAAAGGAAGAGTVSANDSGGGGGGGRIKVFHVGVITNTATLVVAGGSGGPNGGAAPGQPGAAGVIHVQQL